MYHKIKMQVCKRDGSYEDVSFDKISHRIQALSKDLKVEPLEVSKMVCSRIIDKISTTQLDTFADDIIDEEAEQSFRQVMALLDEAAAIKSAKANHIRQ